MYIFYIKSKGVRYRILADEEDRERLSKYSWYISKRGTYINIAAWINGKEMRIGRFLLGVDKTKKVVDHINGDPKDNRKANLRLCTTRQNAANTKQKTGKGRYRGVYKSKRVTGNRAIYNKKGKTYHIPKVFRTAKEAAIARDKVVKRLRGKFAVLNFPDQG